jgi:hypothetical protein
VLAERPRSTSAYVRRRVLGYLHEHGPTTSAMLWQALRWDSERPFSRALLHVALAILEREQLIKRSGAGQRHDPYTWSLADA